MSADIQAPDTQKTYNIEQWTRHPGYHSRLVEALGDAMPSEQFIAHAIVAFNDPAIAVCTIQSKLNAMLEMAALGVLPTLGQAALIKYWNSDLGQSEVQLRTTWQGFKAVMERHPDIQEVTPCLVHVTDTFNYENGVVRHSFDPFNPDRTITGPQDIRGGYLRITYRDGRPDKYHFSPVAYIEKCKACAKPAKKSGKREVWESWYEQQALKTVIRDGYARRAVPIDPLAARRMEKLLRSDDAMLGNDPQRPALTAPSVNQEDDGQPALPAPKSRVEELAARCSEVAPDGQHGSAATMPPQSSPQPILDAIAAATTVDAVRKAVKEAHDTLRLADYATVQTAGLKREEEIAKAATTDKPKEATPPPAKTKTARKFNWKAADAAGRRDYTNGEIAKAEALADPKAALEKLSTIGKGLNGREADLGDFWQPVQGALLAAQQGQRKKYGLESIAAIRQMPDPVTGIAKLAALITELAAPDSLDEAGAAEVAAAWEAADAQFKAETQAESDNTAGNAAPFGD